MEFDVSYSLEDDQQFWDELGEIVGSPCDAPQRIDSSLKAYLSFVTDFQDEYLGSAADWARCSYTLLDSPLFSSDKAYIRACLIGRLREDDSKPLIYLTSMILLLDGRENEQTFKLMQAEGLFPRLLQLIVKKKAPEDSNCRNHLFNVLYEMIRIQRLRWEDLGRALLPFINEGSRDRGILDTDLVSEEVAAIDDGFVSYLFELVEEQAEIHDPYHYVVIRVLLVLNEQYMVSEHAPLPTTDNVTAGQEGLTNKVIKVLCFKGDVYKTFGENIILLLNRETETSLQLLILKLVFLLCTTSATCEYFYRNDLYVLCDVVIRNLLDFPDNAESLRHTYLRVLYPLLAYTQLRNPPFYKCSELLKLFDTLASIRYNHFEPVDETTTRLVDRCRSVPWLVEAQRLGEDEKFGNGSITASVSDTGGSPFQESPQTAAVGIPAGVAAVLGMSLPEGLKSQAEVAVVAEKPGVMAPSRSRASSGTAPSSLLPVGLNRPPPPPPPPIPHGKPLPTQTPPPVPHRRGKFSPAPPPPPPPPPRLHPLHSSQSKPGSPPPLPVHPPRALSFPLPNSTTPPPEKKVPPPPPLGRRKRGVPPPPPKPRGTPTPPGSGVQSPSPPCTPPSRAVTELTLSTSFSASPKTKEGSWREPSVGVAEGYSH